MPDPALTRRTPSSMSTDTRGSPSTDQHVQRERHAGDDLLDLRGLDHAGEEEPVGAGVAVLAAAGDGLLHRALLGGEAPEVHVTASVDEQVHAGAGRATLGGGDALAEDLRRARSVLEVDSDGAHARQRLGVLGDGREVVRVARLHVDGERHPDDPGDLR